MDLYHHIRVARLASSQVPSPMIHPLENCRRLKSKRPKSSSRKKLEEVASEMSSKCVIPHELPRNTRFKPFICYLPTIGSCNWKLRTCGQAALIWAHLAFVSEKTNLDAWFGNLQGSVRGKTVAIKKLHAQDMDPSTLEEFRKEVEIMTYVPLMPIRKLAQTVDH